jgi:protein required for attachment to host cells
MDRTWVVIANTTKARFLAGASLHRPLEELRTLMNPQGRLHEGDLVTDSAGRTRHSRQHALSQRSAKEHVVDLFAKQVADEIERGRSRSEIGELYLVASPEFLGLLRQRLSAATLRTVVLDVVSDLVLADEAEVRATILARRPTSIDPSDLHP